MQHNILYCRDIVVAVNPFQKKKGSVERGALWTQIANNLNSLVQPKFIVTQRSVREHLAILQKKYLKLRRLQKQSFKKQVGCSKKTLTKKKQRQMNCNGNICRNTKKTVPERKI